jgi:putative membrane protein
VIDYDRSAWWRTMLSFHGTVLPAVLGRAGLLTALALALCMLDEFVLPRYGVKLPPLDQLGHVVLGTALGMFIAFRSNSSYGRFWEARSHWGGIINTSRNLVRSAAANAGPADELARIVAAFAVVLRQTLRSSKDFTELRGVLPADLYDKLAHADDAPGSLARAMSDWIATRLANGKLPPPQAERLETLVCMLVDFQGGCEKIQRTPMPFVYASLIKLILFVYLASLPFVLVSKMGFAAPLVVAVVAFGMLGIEEAGVDIENPFSFDPNALPLEAICQRIAGNVAEAAKGNRP